MEFEKLQAIIMEVLNKTADDIKLETTFVDELGADSLDIFQIVTAVEYEFSIHIKDQDMEAIRTVADALKQIETAVN